MRYAFKTDRGLIREKNEDSCSILAGYPGVPVTFLIADGMGGHNSGEVASSMAVEAVSNYVLQNAGRFETEEDIQTMICQAIKEANRKIYEESIKDGLNSGMGTTFIAAVAMKNKLIIGHVGDSRVYIARKGKLQRVTTDHSYVEELIKNGSLSREEAQNHPGRNLITRALGCVEDIEVDTYISEYIDNDCFLLCTDGLTNMLEETWIIELLDNTDSPQAACEELVAQANEKGGEDNVTVIVIRTC